VGRIVSNFFISLDGVVERPDQWHFPYFDDEMGAVIGAGMETAGAFMMGRTLYGEWSDYWTTTDQDQDFATFINSIKKYVVSSTLDDADVTWSNTALITGDEDAVRAGIQSAKDATDGDIQISGSPTLVRSLLGMGLLDELALLVHPIAVGTGERLFQDTPTYPLELTSHKALGSGVLHLTYAPVRS
jgi:dihydrofolate reductase